VKQGVMRVGGGGGGGGGGRGALLAISNTQECENQRSEAQTLLLVTDLNHKSMGHNHPN